MKYSVNYILFKIKQCLAFFLIMLGISLLMLSLLGDYGIDDSDGSHVITKGETVDKHLANVKSVGDILHILRVDAPEYNNFPEEKRIIILYDIVTNRFSHCSGDKHTIRTNWILWTLGLIHPVLRTTWNPNIWLRKADCLVCSQSSYLLMKLSIAVGIRARHVGLDGHVVMEAWYQNDWHMFDPDMRVIPRDERGSILSVEQLAMQPTLVERYYIGDKSPAGKAIISRENNSFVSYPLGAYFEWKSQVMMYVEKFLDIMKYVLPLLFIYIGFKRRRIS